MLIQKESRNIIIKLTDTKTINPNMIKSILVFESDWLQYKASYYNDIGNEYTNRSSLILNRF